MTTPQSSLHESENQPQVPDDKFRKDIDEVDCEKQFVSFNDEDDEDYVRVAGGKILNRTNCTYRRKLNSKKIDPISVISTEPEYVSDKTNYVDDKVMKENLLTNLMNDIESEGHQHENVVFYQNSILEDMANKVTVEVEVHQQDTNAPGVSTIAKPFQVAASKSLQFKDTSETKSAENSANHSTSILPNDLSNSNPLLKEQPAGFTFGCKPVNEADSPKMSNKSSDFAQNLQPTSKIENVPVAVSVSFTLPITSNSTKTEIITPTTNVKSFTPMVKPFSEGVNTFSESTAVTSSVVSNSPKINFSSPTTTQNNNPLFAKPSVSTTIDFTSNVPTFGNSTGTTNVQNSTEQTAATPKISMFGNTVIRPVTANLFANQTSVNSFMPLQNNAVTATESPFSSTIQSSSTLANPSFTANQPSSITTTLNTNTGSSNSNGFKFGESSHPAVTTSTNSVFKVNSSPTTAVPSFGATTAPSFGNTFTSATTSSSFPVTTEKPSMFTNATNSSGTPSFNFGASNTNGIFGTNTSQPGGAFNSSPNQPSVFGGNQSTTTTTLQASVFGNQPALNFNATPSVGQSSSAAPIFGNDTASNSLQNTQPTMFGSSVFGQPSQTNRPAIFGGGNAAAQTGGSGDGGNAIGNAFGKSPNSATNAAQTPQFGSNSGGFVFGGSADIQTSSSATFGSVASPFNSNVNGIQSTFGTNTAPAALNFSPPATNFGSNSTGIGGNSFAAPSTTQPASNSVFNFGSNVNSSGIAPQPAFQFRPNVPSQPNQSFMFGGNNNVPAPAPNTGGFSIGSGGGGGSTRNRAMARPRKAK